MNKSEKFWDKTAEKYAASPIRDEETYNKKLAKTQEYFTPDMAVMEFGCGTGTTAIHHAPHVKSYLATDVSGNMVEIGRKKAEEAGITNLTFEKATLESMDCPPESFDVILGLNI
ncbi:MAG: class I SAM-dependent methyltransferase, partial [Gammaproteobacteria bacterium]|nr:class I SAM-dependent methyltransferase [Gammaproteobacteria bacterium]